MFPTSIYNHQALHDARQRELEADAQVYRLLKATRQAGEISPVRHRIGILLIQLGTKIAQMPQQDVRLVFSTRQ